jgi:hypothetical protein
MKLKKRNLNYYLESFTQIVVKTEDSFLLGWRWLVLLTKHLTAWHVYLMLDSRGLKEVTYAVYCTFFSYYRSLKMSMKKKDSIRHTGGKWVVICNSHWLSTLVIACPHKYCLNLFAMVTGAQLQKPQGCLHIVTVMLWWQNGCLMF